MRSWLVAMREEQGIKQCDVAKKVGIAQPSYNMIEKGKRNPAVKTAKAIADVLGFDWTRFYAD